MCVCVCVCVRAFVCVYSLCCYHGLPKFMIVGIPKISEVYGWLTIDIYQYNVATLVFSNGGKSN